MSRVERLRARMAELNLEAALITQPDNRRYISGFTGSAGALLVTATEAFIITDFRYFEQAAQQAPAFILIKQTKTFKDALRTAVKRANVSRLAFESRDVSVGLYQDMCEALKGRGKRLIAELVPTSDLVEPLRAIKDESEIQVIARAAAITDAALAAALPSFVPGITEKQAAWEIERRMREMGAQGVGFELIVASGPNSARPHARPTERPLQAGEPVVIDIGARVDGYVSDMTRTICLSKPTVRFTKIYNIVLQAQKEALAAVRAGPTGKEIDAIARRIITEAGYGSRFGHGLGHGVGLAVHERPQLSFRDQEAKPLQAGMVVTIEPGIYLPGWGGVRIEDLVLVTENGAKILSTAPK